jgi:hypothetical protein
MLRIKNTDAKKLQDEYEKLVSGLAQANDTREDEDMMASPGTLPQPLLSGLMISVIERYVGRGYSWEYQESRTFHRFPETFHRVPKGKLSFTGEKADIRLE